MMGYDAFDSSSVLVAVITFGLMMTFAFAVKKSKLTDRYSLFPLMLILILCLIGTAIFTEAILNVMTECLTNRLKLNMNNI